MSDSSLPRVEFWCDLLCPDCRTALDDVRALRERFGDALTVELRHFPLEKHKYAYPAAEAAAEAFEQGRGWEFAEAVLARLEDVERGGPAVLVEIAGAVGVDADEVDTALIDGRHMLWVDSDVAEGRAIGVKGTPTYVVAGKRLDGGQSQDGLRERIVELLNG
ncbi:DSBA-like thioredoxin domain-containing protein [Kitasatospora sp. SolWspMP-SS2h]|uniref:DsbA family protein n=1 Tax=Kitasatospora sp. SolWspMP-SS2h TaxID=1305729 RepID=UPI000DBA1ABE|nr:DsbA family protein [Kitasatospora sp. SolWspMP-SS2h]RAJ29185.1 DSBA-like thioredoxin domain-containing protein [Kitasatospora sp. SolWspMP-SS2h]